MSANQKFKPSKNQQAAIIVNKINDFMSMESKQSTNLEAWLTHPGADEYFGRRTAFKIAVLAHLLSGQGTLADVGRRFGAGRSAACHHATKARKLFGIA